MWIELQDERVYFCEYRRGFYMGKGKAAKPFLKATADLKSIIRIWLSAMPWVADDDMSVYV